MKKTGAVFVFLFLVMTVLPLISREGPGFHEGRETDSDARSVAGRTSLSPVDMAAVSARSVEPGRQDTLFWRRMSAPEIDFAFDNGDSMAMWFNPVAPCTILAVRFMPSNFVGSVVLDIWESRYDGTLIDVPVGSSIYRPDSPLGGHLAGPATIFITSPDSGSWMSIDLEDRPYAEESFFVGLEFSRTGGWGFSAEGLHALPYHSLKYYAPPRIGPDGVHSGWFFGSISMWVEAVVSFGPVDAYTVNTTDDIDDGTCDEIHCSLREALQAANVDPGRDFVFFDIPGPGPHTISFLSPLPAITDAVEIDGYTQPGASANSKAMSSGNDAVLLIELDGSDVDTSADGLSIQAPWSTIRGLVVNRFGGNGIAVENSHSAQIEGNFIGTDVAGTAGAGNGKYGILLTSESTTVGGMAAEARNIIADNRWGGIAIIGSELTNNFIVGNFIGTDRHGTRALGNDGDGIFVYQDSIPVVYGGDSYIEGNLISGNLFNGISICHGSDLHIGNNYVGTDATGTVPLGNTHHGMRVFSESRSIKIGPGVIDGVGQMTPNRIAYNGGDGIYIESGSAININYNSIVSNFGLGIDLGGDGVTANDIFDEDEGANDLQNYPILTSVNSVVVRGLLHSCPSSDMYDVHFYLNSDCDTSGHGEGESYIGSVLGIATNDSGNADFVFDPPMVLPEGGYITATAGRTSISEFSPCAVVNPLIHDITIVYIECIAPFARNFPISAIIGVGNGGPGSAKSLNGSYAILDKDLVPISGYPRVMGPFTVGVDDTVVFQFQWTPKDTGIFYVKALVEEDQGDGDPMNNVLVSAPVHVVERQYGKGGDVNNDGAVNVLDALHVVNSILGFIELSYDEAWRGDCNRDGVNNVLDVLGIVNVVLGSGICATTCEDLDCDDGNPCTEDSCDAELVQCFHRQVTEGTPCDDGDRCTENDRCSDGHCQGTITNCDDNDPCTADDCDPDAGCTHVELCCDNGSDDDGDGYPDCSDGDCFVDNDGDGHDVLPCGDDCDDTDVKVHPGATEICDDGVDNNCNGWNDCEDPVCLVDADGDGHDALPCGDDCDDLAPAVHPGAQELCSDGRDNDCDGPVDCNDNDCLVDADYDGYDALPCGPDCNDGDQGINPGAIENCTDGKDNDCDGKTDCSDSDCRIDADGDGSYVFPCGQDCNDNDHTVYPGAPEICDDGKDNNCDQAADCQDNSCWKDSDYDQYYAEPCGDDCDDGDSYVHPGAQEDCQDSKDNDCDDEVDCDDTDCANDPNCQ